ncbi:MAG: S49 family peptidase [Roseiflexaceae bacterium]|nr:S49 family peptidase [Roseiflexaceae bacterium]
MIASLVIGITNVVRRLRNAWRRLLRRRVDYVRIRLAGGLPEFAAPLPWWRKRLLGGQAGLSLSGLRRQLQRIGDDPQAQGIVLEINGFAAGWATMQSLRDELHSFRERGKRVVALVYTLDNAGFYVACAADQILAPPTAMFSVLGFHTEVQYLRDALARIGVEAEVEAVSPYKAAYERFIRSEMTPENRAQTERLLDGRYSTLVESIASARGLPPERVRALIDQAPLRAAEACEAGLLDALLYDDELIAHLQQGEREPVVQEWPEAQKALRLPMLRRFRKLVGVVAIEGTIVQGGSQRLPVPLPLLGQQQAGSDSVAQAIRAAERNKRLAAVVLYINSPGGDAFASDLIWREIVRLQKQKPVVAVMGDVAASGGYYIAAPTARIIAQPGTITGSIGVISLRPNLSGLLAKADIHTTTLSRGANSGLLASSQPLSESQRAAWRRMLLATYTEFKDRVKSGRQIDEDALEPIAGGRVWSGADARDLRLVDGLGGLPAGVRAAQELAKLPLDERAPLVMLRGGPSSLPPQPFPADSLAALLAAVEVGLKPRIWAILPWQERA